MGVSIVQTSPRTRVTTAGASSAFGSNVTAGSQIIVVALTQNRTTSVVPTDTLGNTYVLDGTRTEAGYSSFQVSVYRTTSASGGANTVSLGRDGADVITLVCHEVSGLRSSPLDKSVGSDDSNWGLSASTGATSGTLAQADELVYVLASGRCTQTVAVGFATLPPPTGFTAIGTAYLGDGTYNNFPCHAAYMVVSSTDAIIPVWNPTETQTNNNPSAALLTVTYKAAVPTIDTQPANAVAREGDVASFTVAATTSGGSLSYQWQDNSGGSFANISGATSATYATPPVSLTWNGLRYRCAVTDSNGTVYTNGNAKLAVFASEWAAPRRAPPKTTHDWSAAGWFSPAIEAGHLWDADLITQPAAGGTLPTGRADEADSALPLGSARPAAASSETDAALACGGVAIRVAGRADEADAALTLGSARPAGLATEADAALARGGVQIRAVGLATEADTALALSGVAIRATGRADEADTAVALAGVHLRAVGLSTETDAALALVPRQIGAVGLTVETDTALALSAGASSAVGLATEVDTALALAAKQIRAVGLATETDTALAIAPKQILPTGLAVETDTALALAGVQRLPAGLAAEADAALALSALAALPVGRADEADTALELASPAPSSPPAETISLSSAICPAVALLGRIARQVDAASAIVRQLAAASPIATAAGLQSPVTTTVALHSTLEHETS